MNKLILSILILVSITAVKAQSKLEVEITNLRNNIGHVALNLVDENNETVKGAKKGIENNKCTIVFNGIENGKYAIQYFHDENINDKLDKNIIGIPKEGFGFSNNAMGLFGPKDFEEWLFPISGDTKIELKTFYLL